MELFVMGPERRQKQGVGEEFGLKVIIEYGNKRTRHYLC